MFGRSGEAHTNLYSDISNLRHTSSRTFLVTVAVTANTGVPGGMNARISPTRA